MHQNTTQHVHILGVCGTAMAAIAGLAKEQGWFVTGSDEGVYPPMSDLLASKGIKINPFDVANLNPAPDLCIIGNALSRGNVEVEAILDLGLPYCSGPAFVGDHVLAGRHVAVVAGTHGKTSTSSLLAFVLDQAGLKPGFLIGGIPEDFHDGARLADHSTPFVIEGDEYDTAFFDKRSKFLHYHAHTLILNNLEYDHADIFPDLESIKRQFAHLLRTVPASGKIVVNADDSNLTDVLTQGCWTPLIYFSHRDHARDSDWHWKAVRKDGSEFILWHHNEIVIHVHWAMIGQHQVANACATAAAAHAMGVSIPQIANAFQAFSGIRRRMSLVDTVFGVRIFDDFAHHPTAIRGIVEAAKASIQSNGCLWVILEPRSNTMRSRIHQSALTHCFSSADRLLCLPPGARGKQPSELLDVQQLCEQLGGKATVTADIASLISIVAAEVCQGDDILILSNGGVEHLHQALKDGIKCVKPVKVK